MSVAPSIPASSSRPSVDLDRRGLQPTDADPHPLTVLTPAQSWFGVALGDLWRYRELLYFLTWRDLKVRYKQTVLGAAWAVLQPLFTMVLYSALFGMVAKLPSAGLPYPVFTFTALLPWQLFAFALTNASGSLIGNQNLITKVYFPRVIIPLAATLPGLVDFAISLVVLFAMMFAYGVPLTPRILAIPLFLLLALASAISVGMWLSALNVRYRDVRHVIPFLATLWQYATPVGYSEALIPARWRFVYGLNPMVGVVRGFRWALLGVGELDRSVWASGAVVGVLLVTGFAYFSWAEYSFADVI
jgi:lipopolysaccharide transport system permease protein